MTDKKTFGLALLGFGTIGAGVVETLQRNGELMEKRTGFGLELRKIADLDLTSDRGVEVDASIMTDDAIAAIEDPSVDVVIELIGGTTFARTAVIRAIELGKPVVTANKALLAEHGEELYKLAEKNGVDIFYEASVGGGIPVIRSLREGLSGNHIESIYGILNGTCNYILTRMEREGIVFDDVLDEAQKLGFAEADPALDIDGFDTCHKAVILASLAYGFHVPMESVKVEGIRGISTDDIAYAAELGYRVKLLASIVHSDNQVEVSVRPTLIATDHMLASVSGVFNAVMVRGDIVDDTLYYGRGAGRLPTASAVVGDVVDAARNLAAGAAMRVPAFAPHEHYGDLRELDEVITRYYLRLELQNNPGMIAKFSAVLAEQNLSIASIVQKEATGDGLVPVIILTHKGTEGAFKKALETVAQLDGVGEKIVKMRIEDFA